jgi:hypothetical protein
LEESEYPNLYKTKSGISLLADESNSEQDGEAGMICPTTQEETIAWANEHLESISEDAFDSIEEA